MDSIFILLIVMVVLVMVVLRLRLKQSGPARDMTYEARKDLFSPAERSFLGVLEQAIEGRYRVHGKVRLGDLIQPVRGYSRSQRTVAWNRINRKHVDFVLCQPDTLAPVGAVELDDASHQRKDRSDRDAFVDQALYSAGIPMVRFAARKGYSVAELKAQLEAVLSPKEENFALGETPSDSSTVAKSLSAGDDLKVKEENETVPSPETVNEPASSKMVCPVCHSPMVKRLAKKGTNAGKWFWACSAFPKCRKVVGIE